MTSPGSSVTTKLLEDFILAELREEDLAVPFEEVSNLTALTHSRDTLHPGWILPCCGGRSWPDAQRATSSVVSERSLAFPARSMARTAYMNRLPDGTSSLKVASCTGGTAIGWRTEPGSPRKMT